MRQAGMRGIRAAALGMALLAAGCAGTEPYLRQAEREQLGRVGVVAAAYQPRVEMRRPRGKVDGALAGAGEGAVQALAIIGESDCHGDGCGEALLVMTAVMVPVGFVYGGVMGAREGVDSDEVAGWNASIGRAMDELGVQDAMAQALASAVSARSGSAIEVAGASGPGEPDAEVDHAAWEGAEMDTALVSEVESFGLRTMEPGSNPRLTFLMRLRARLIRASDGREIYSGTFECRKGSARFDEWASENARAFAEAFGTCYHDLAGQVGERLYW
jgi:hypothetical protein